MADNSSKPLDRLANTDENIKEANKESYSPWMLVNRRGLRKNSQGGREPKFESKGIAQKKDMFKPNHLSRAMHKRESSNGPSMLHKDSPSAKNLVLEKSVVSDNPFTSLIAEDTLMDSSAEARVSPPDKAFPAAVNIFAEPCDKVLKPSSPRTKEPPDPISFLPNISHSKYGDSSGEPT